MKRIMQLLFLMFLLHQNSHPQQSFMSSEYINRLNKVFISPQVSAFQKYSYYPVSPSTGTTNIQVPIYTLTQGRLTHAISLDYHTGGIKVNDVSTALGLGWLLNAGGVISRSQQGIYEDEHFTNGYLVNNSSIPKQSDLDIIRSSGEYSQERKDFFYFCKNALVPQGQTGDLGVDLEPDMFCYNFQGKTGVFYFSTSGEIVTENLEPLKITCTGYNGFKIKDELGIIYLFEGKTQRSNKSNYEVNLLSGHNLFLYDVTGNRELPSDAARLLSGNLGNWFYLGNRTVPYTPFNAMSSTSAWYLTQIIHPNTQDTIYFDYKQIYYTSPLHSIQSKEVVYEHQGQFQSYVPYDINLIETQFYNQIADYLLTKIRFKSGEVIFNYAQDRIDSNSKDRLASIICKDNKNENVFIVEFDNNKYFTANSGVYNSDNRVNKRLKLERVLFKDNNNIQLNAYEFRYNETTLPPINSKSVDHWGYFNGKGNSSLIPRITIKDKDVTYGNANRTADENYMKAFILEKIIYPTKGMTSFDYSCHKVHNSHSKTHITDVGGLRVSSMRLYPDYQNTSDYMIKEYEYSYDDVTGVGRNISNVGAEFNFQFMNRYGDKGLVYTKSFIINSWPVNTINLPDFSNAVYDKITEFDKSATGDILGKKESIFNIGSFPNLFHDSYTNGDLVLLNIYDFHDPEKLTFRTQNSYNNSFFVPVKTFYSLRNRPYLLKEFVYDKDNKRLKETSFSYKVKESSKNKVEGFFVSSYNEYVESSSGYVGDESYYPYKYYYFLYDIPIQKRQLVSRSDYSLTSSGEILTNTKFEYESENGLLRKSTTTSSEGQTVTHENWYPFDYSTSIPVIETLNDKHILEPIIMQIKRVNNKVVDGFITDVNERAEPITILNFKKKSNTNIDFNPNTIIQTSKFEKVLGITNNNGRIVETKSRNEVPIIYLWGYNYQYPIAEIKNASYDEVKQVLGLDPQKLAETNEPDMSRVNSLRQKLLNAQVTTYTYKPLIGMTSKTSPAGLITTYEYDNLGRLICVKDHNNNVIKEYDYNYKK